MDQNTSPQEQSLPNEVRPQVDNTTQSTEPKSKAKTRKIMGIVAVVVIIIFASLVWWGNMLYNQTTNNLTNDTQQITMDTQRSDTIGSFIFPAANYKDFAIAANSDMLNPAKAYPKVEEYGGPHLEITKDVDGYSETSLRLLGIVLNVPFGWGSKGGFDTMERVDFFPATSTEALIKAMSDGAAIDLGVKVLDSSSVAPDFKGVMTKVQEMSSDNKQSITTEVDEQNRVFLIKTENINNPKLAAPSSLYSLYIQDPNPNSTAWVEIGIRAPKTEFQKYLGLLGLVYKDIKINWAGLDAYLKQGRQ